MRTDDLIGRLAAQPAPARRRPVETRLGLAAAIALGALAALVLGLLGARPDLGASLLSPAGALRVLGAAAIAAAGFRLATRLTRPGTPALCPVTVTAVLALLAVAAAAFAAAGTGLRLDAAPGPAMICARRIFLLALLPLAAMLAALRGGAPTRPALAGAVAGMTAGALAAAGFALACPVDDVGHVALGYGAAIALMTALGAAAGHRFLAW